MAFETYLDHQVAPDGDTRRRLTALAAVTIFTASVGILAVVADRMRITRVTAPEGRAVIQDLNEAVLPPPPSPPPVRGSESGKAAIPEERERDEPEVHDDFEEIIPAPKKAPVSTAKDAVPKGVSGGGGPITGVPGGMGTVPGGIGTGPIVPTPPVIPPTGEGPARTVKFSALECRACPDPAERDLSRAIGTAPARLKKNKTKFCVGTDGHTTKVATAQRSGNPEVDRLCREAVKQWRFQPVRIDGKVRQTCSTVSFDIQRGG